MKYIPLIKSFTFAVVAIVMVVYHDLYDQFVYEYDLPERLLQTVYRVVVVFCIVECVRLIIIYGYKPQGGAKRDNFTTGIGHIAKVIYSFLLIVLILSLFNVTLKEAATSLSLIAAAVVLMTKDYISNLINGMYLTFTKVINIGDNVEIANYKGKILDITLTNVHLLNDDDDIIYIPNNKVFSNEIINYTRRQLKKSSVEFEMDARYAQPTAQIERRLIDSLGELTSLIQPNTFNLKVQSIKHEYTSYKFQYILYDPLNKEHDKKVKRHLVREIMNYTIELRDAYERKKS
ncbi:MAG TPA: mechanosensitive ion channel domain-containing protein [Flavobacteriales bacterium]|jgi:small-conductance mechanosensitive channel